MKEIKVKGTYTGSTNPNWVVVVIDLREKNQDYQMAINAIKERTAILRDDLAKVGFQQSEIKTVDFKVETLYQYIDQKRIFDGYLVSHQLKIEFVFEQMKLEEVITALSQSQAKPDFDLMFTLKESDEFKNKLIVAATKQAQERALVLADSLGIKLGEIIQVIYEDDQPELLPIHLEQAVTMAQTKIDIHPTEIEVTQSVLITWEIESLYPKYKNL